ncbi:MAG: Ig-like domain-containing protein [Bacteroidales bacterium]|nr:Ig-like domain-containing protein [Bacteroidales bacterium]
MFAVIFTSCKKDDDPIQLTLVSATAGDVSINEAAPPTNVPVNAVIVATFSTNVDQLTATAANITLTRGFDDADVQIGIAVAGKVVTITPDEQLYGGASYTISFGAGLLSTDGLPLTTLSRAFTTIGTFVPSGQLAYFSFEDNANDMVGNHDPLPSGIIGITYVTSRKTEAGKAANFTGATDKSIIEIPNAADLINPSTTYSIWFKVATADFAGGGSRILFGLAVERGFFMEIAENFAWFKLATSHLVDPDPMNHIFGTAWTDPNGDGNMDPPVLYDYSGSISTLIADKWSHLVMTYDATTSIKTIFIDGSKVMQIDLNAETTEWYLTDFSIADHDGVGAITGIDPVLTLGYFCSRANTATGWADYSTATNTFKGQIDDFRVFNKSLTEIEVGLLYNSEK